MNGAGSPKRGTLGYCSPACGGSQSAGCVAGSVCGDGDPRRAAVRLAYKFAATVAKSACVDFPRPVIPSQSDAPRAELASEESPSSASKPPSNVADSSLRYRQTTPCAALGMTEWEFLGLVARPGGRPQLAAPVSCLRGL